MLLMSVPLRATLTPRAGSTNGGRLICTNASPPETRSARFESTIISGPAATADVDSENASTAAANNEGRIELKVHRMFIPPWTIQPGTLLPKSPVARMQATTPVTTLSYGSAIDCCQDESPPQGSGGSSRCDATNSSRESTVSKLPGSSAAWHAFRRAVAAVHTLACSLRPCKCA